MNSECSQRLVNIVNAIYDSKQEYLQSLPRLAWSSNAECNDECQSLLLDSFLDDDLIDEIIVWSAEHRRRIASLVVLPLSLLEKVAALLGVMLHGDRAPEVVAHWYKPLMLCFGKQMLEVKWLLTYLSSEAVSRPWLSGGPLREEPPGLLGGLMLADSIRGLPEVVQPLLRRRLGLRAGDLAKFPSGSMSGPDSAGGGWEYQSSAMARSFLRAFHPERSWVCD